MAKTLPQRFNPDLLARDDTRFELVVPQRQMKRLSAMLSLADNDIVVTAHFSRRKDHIVVNGRLRTEFTLQCQRCLEPMQYSIDEFYELVFVDDEDSAENLPKQLDPVILDEHGHIHVVDLYEDEVILHVPAVPKHALDDPDGAECVAGLTEFGSVSEDVVEEKPNPFETLKGLQLH